MRVARKLVDAALHLAAEMPHQTLDRPGRRIAQRADRMTLEPGDLIATGTPSGVAHARKPPAWMKAGDKVEVEVEGIGVLANPIVDAA